MTVSTLLSPRPPIGGAGSVAALDAVVDFRGEPHGHQQIEIETRKDPTQIVSHGKTSHQKRGPCSIEDHGFIDRDLFKGNFAEITCVVL